MKMALGTKFAGHGTVLSGQTVLSRRRRRGLVAAASVLTAGGMLLGVAGAGAATAAPRSAAARSAAPHRGGSLTVLEGTGYAGSWPGLDPATDTDGAANESYMDAIYGQLFDLGPGGRLESDLATGYRFSNGGKTITLTLRRGVKFSDGTPFDSAAVVYNWKRDLAGTCTCKPVFNQKATPVIKADGAYAVSITLQYVDAPFVNALQDDIFSWIASPTAIKKMGETAFAQKPVGAGPFVVVSDSPNTELVLKRNPDYFEKGLPYLNQLVFKTVASDQAAYEAMLAGSGQAYEGMSTPQLASDFRAHFDLTTEPSTSPYAIQLDALAPPFNNIKAREAVYYALDCPVLDKKLFDDTTPCGESFEAPAGLFYEKTVPGYRTYDPRKAAALVKQLGGLSFDLISLESPVDVELLDAFQSEFRAVGMTVHIALYDLSTLIAHYSHAKWQAALEAPGAYDPGTGIGVGFWFDSTSPYSGIHSKALDDLIQDAAATTDVAKRKHYYDAAAEYIAKYALSPFLFPRNNYNAVIHGAGGPGLSTQLPSAAVLPEVLWQYAYNDKG